MAQRESREEKILQHMNFFKNLLCVFKVNKSVYIAKSRQRYYLTLNEILLHVSNHALKDT